VVAEGDQASPQITGTSQDDVLIGSPSANTNKLDGNEGNDILYATTAKDVLVFKMDGGHDTVIGFNPAQDYLDVSGHSIEENAIADFLDSSVMDTAAGAVISFDPATTVLIEGVLKANIDASHLIVGAGA
jgi:Ca2+-binding RTX toxin-like protein